MTDTVDLKFMISYLFSWITHTKKIIQLFELVHVLYPVWGLLDCSPFFLLTSWEI